jgi:hypothetical protein
MPRLGLDVYQAFAVFNPETGTGVRSKIKKTWNVKIGQKKYEKITPFASVCASHRAPCFNGTSRAAPPETALFNR